MKDIYFPKLAGQLADLYLEWWNDWLTVERFAEYHGVSVADATTLINMGREYHNQRAERIKEVESARALVSLVIPTDSEQEVDSE